MWDPQHWRSGRVSGVVRTHHATSLLLHGESGRRHDAKLQLLAPNFRDTQPSYSTRERPWERTLTNVGPSKPKIFQNPFPEQGSSPTENPDFEIERVRDHDWNYCSEICWTLKLRKWLETLQANDFLLNLEWQIVKQEMRSGEKDIPHFCSVAVLVWAKG